MYKVSKDFDTNEHDIVSGSLDYVDDPGKPTRNPTWGSKIEVHGDSHLEVQQLLQAICNSLNKPSAPSFDEQALRYARFFSNLNQTIHKAGGTGLHIFSDEELAKMATVFANNHITVNYSGA